MAASYKVFFKNHCTPQEKVDFGDGAVRWYLDSDVGSKLSGGYTFTSSNAPVYTASVTIASNAGTPVSIGATTQDFVYIKNLGLTSAGAESTANIYISLDGTGGKYRIKLAPGESFASTISGASAGSEANDVYMKTGSGEAEQTVETLRIT